jgi:hypothetical protein
MFFYVLFFLFYFYFLHVLHCVFRDPGGPWSMARRNSDCVRPACHVTRPPTTLTYTPSLRSASTQLGPPLVSVTSAPGRLPATARRRSDCPGPVTVGGKPKLEAMKTCTEKAADSLGHSDVISINKSVSVSESNGAKSNSESQSADWSARNLTVPLGHVTKSGPSAAASNVEGEVKSNNKTVSVSGSELPGVKASSVSMEKPIRSTGARPLEHVTKPGLSHSPTASSRPKNVNSAITPVSVSDSELPGVIDVNSVSFSYSESPGCKLGAASQSADKTVRCNAKSNTPVVIGRKVSYAEQIRSLCNPGTETPKRLSLGLVRTESCGRREDMEKRRHSLTGSRLIQASQVFDSIETSSFGGLKVQSRHDSLRRTGCESGEQAEKTVVENGVVSSCDLDDSRLTWSVANRRKVFDKLDTK